MNVLLNNIMEWMSSSVDHIQSLPFGLDSHFILIMVTFIYGTIMYSTKIIMIPCLPLLKRVGILKKN